MTAAAIVFDLDDTLYLERDFAFSGYEAVGAAIRARTGCPEFAAVCRALFEGGERTRIFDKALRRAGLAAGPDDVAWCVGLYREHMPRIALCADAARYLRAARAPLGLITDGPAVTQGNKIAALRLTRWIAHICITGAFGAEFAKPHPRAFAAVAAAIGGSPGRFVYVADNPRKDFVTPNRLGWTSVRVVRPGQVHCAPELPPGYDAAATIETLDALDDTLATLRVGAQPA